MPTNLTEFVDWTSKDYALRIYENEIHILDRWLNTIVRVGAQAPKPIVIDILRSFNFTKEVTQ
jgi:hypothetical protein